MLIPALWPLGTLILTFLPFALSSSLTSLDSNTLSAQPHLYQPSSGDLCDSTPTGPIETTLCDYESIETVNDLLYAHLKDLVRTPSFRFFQVGLYRECPFWQENGYCVNRECGITTVDEVWLLRFLIVELSEGKFLSRAKSQRNGGLLH